MELEAGWKINREKWEDNEKVGKVLPNMERLAGQWNLIENVKYEDAAQWTKTDRSVQILTALAPLRKKEKYDTHFNFSLSSTFPPWSCGVICYTSSEIHDLCHLKWIPEQKKQTKKHTSLQIKFCFERKFLRSEFPVCVCPIFTPVCETVSMWHKKNMKEKKLRFSQQVLAHYAWPMVR